MRNMEDDLMYTTARRRFTTKRFARQPAVVALIASLIAHGTPALAQRVTEGETREVDRSVMKAENADQIWPAFLRESIIREAVHLAQSSPPVAQPGPPKRSWASRHPVVLGTLIGVGGGEALAAAGGDGAI